MQTQAKTNVLPLTDSEGISCFLLPGEASHQTPVALQQRIHKKCAHSDAQAIINLSTENKMH